MSNVNPKNMITFLDPICRTVFGEMIPDSSNEAIIAVKNPVLVNIVFQKNEMGQSTGQMAIQLLPVFFKEFLSDKSADITFNYQRSQISEAVDVVFDWKLVAQYQQIFTPQAQMVPQQQQPPQAAPGNPSVIKLFND